MAKSLIIVGILLLGQTFGVRGFADVDFDDTLSGAEHDLSCAVMFWFLGSTNSIQVEGKPISSTDMLEASHKFRFLAFDRIQALPENQRSAAHKVMVTVRHKTMLEMTKLIRSQNRLQRTKEWLNGEIDDCRAKAPGVFDD